MRSIDERSVALLALASSIVLGLAYPPIAALFAPVALPALLMVVIFSLLPFATVALGDLVSIDGSVGRVILWQQLILPAIVVALGILARLPDQTISLLIVTACSGALFASPALAALLDLDRRKALQCMVLTTLTMPASLYLFLTVVQGTRASLDIELYAYRVLVFLVAPFLMFLAYRPFARRIAVARRVRIETFARWAVVAALAVFGIGMMNRVTGELAVNPEKIVLFFMITTVLCIFMVVLTTIVMHRYGIGDALTAAILSGFRNVGLGYALIGEMLGPDLSVYVGIGLLPVFTAPMLMRIVRARGGPLLQPA